MRARKERREMERMEKRVNKIFNQYLNYLESEGKKVPENEEEWLAHRFAFVKHSMEEGVDLFDKKFLSPKRERKNSETLESLA